MVFRLFLSLMTDFGKPLKIDDNLTLATSAIASPMAGIMSPVFCRTAADLGLVRNWITPFLSISPGSVPSVKSILEKLEPFRNQDALIVQLLGHDPATLAATAKRLAEMGIPGINLNFACPSPLVIKNGNGGAVLANKMLMAKITGAVAEAVGTRANVSVKIRCGAESPEELPEIADILKRCGICFVIAHFRCVNEMYDPVRDPLQRLKKLRDLLPDAILIGNGDIQSRADAEKMVDQTGCDGIAVGRAMLSNPFLLKMICAGSDAAATEEDRMQFLLATLSSARALNYDSQRWLKHSFIEFARMGFGVDSPIFREIAADPSAFVQKNAPITEK